MKERDLIDIIALTHPVLDDDTGEADWRHGWLDPRVREQIINCPPGMRITEIPLELDGIEVGVRFDIKHVLEHCTSIYWDYWRSLN